MALSPSYVNAVVIIPMVTGTVSFASACLMMYMILRNFQRHKQQAKQRLLLGLSIMSLPQSLACTMSTLVGPSQVANSSFPQYGTVRSCELQGFLYQLGLAVPLYNACLCLYFYLVVVKNQSDESLLRCTMPSMHVMVLILATVCAVVPQTMGLYNADGVLGCFVSKPPSCENSPSLCTRGTGWDVFLVQLIVSAVPLGISIMIVLICMVLIYANVRTMENRMIRWEFQPSSHCDAQSTGARSWFSSLHASVQAPVYYDSAHVASNRRKKDETGLNLHGLPIDVTIPIEQSAQQQHTADNENDQDHDYEIGLSHDSDDWEQQQQQDPLADPHIHPMHAFESKQQDTDCMSSDHNIIINNNNNNNNGNHTNEKLDSRSHSSMGARSCGYSVATTPSAARRRHDMKRHHKGSSKVRETGVLYVLSFVVTFLPAIVTIVLPSGSWPWRILLVIFFPLQGFWNLLVYVRPEYSAVRKHYGNEKTRLGAIWCAIFSYEPNEEDHRRRTAHERNRQQRYSQEQVNAGPEGRMS